MLCSYRDVHRMFPLVGLILCVAGANWLASPSALAGGPETAAEAQGTDQAGSGPKAGAGERPAAGEPAGAGDEAKTKAAQFIRVRRGDQREPLALETAVVRYKADKGPFAGVVVDLVGVVHVGDKAYYEQLNKQFAGYEVVLYELVAAEGQNVPQRGTRRGNAHPVGALQLGMKSMLELEFQLDHIDYTQPYMVHADMSPQEFSETMKSRGESFLELFFRMLGQGMAQQAQDPTRSSDLRILAALFSKDRARQMKLAMAEQFESMDGSLAALDGPEGSTIITERNKKALEVLKQQLEAGKKKVAVFYGAGHLPDMQRRLESDFSMSRQGEQWLTAWTLTSQGAAESSGN